MEEDEFKSAVKDKEPEKVEDVDTRGDYNSWEYDNFYYYTPKDECPHCGEYDFRYYIYEKSALLSSNKCGRGAFCDNCEYEEIVDSDPTKGSYRDLG